MAEKKPPMNKHWLIAYAWRRAGGDWQLANDAHKGALVEWLQAVAEFPEEHVLLTAHVVSAADYRWAKDNL